MAKDQNDTKTPDLVGGEASQSVANMVAQAMEDAHLASDHKLVPVRAYIKDESKAEKLTKNNERQKRFAEKQKEAGLTKAFIPADIAETIKATEGGFSAWLEKQKTVVEKPVEKVVEKVVEKPVEVRVEVPVPLTDVQKTRLAIGAQAEKLTGWRRYVVYKILGA